MPDPQLIDAAVQLRGDGLSVSFALDPIPQPDLGPWLLATTLEGRGRPLRRLGLLGDGRTPNLCFAHDLSGDSALVVSSARLTGSLATWTVVFPLSVVGADVPDAWSAAFITQPSSNRTPLTGFVV